MGPLNAIVARRMKGLQIEQMKNKDKRNKMMDEILNGIKIIKLYAWESSFRSKIDAIRVIRGCQLEWYWTSGLRIPYSREQKHVSISDTPMLLIEINSITLTCQIIMQQILLIFGEKNTYTTLLGPTRLLIYEIFPSKPDFHLYKWEKIQPY